MGNTTAFCDSSPTLVGGSTFCDKLTSLLPCGVCIFLCDDDVTISYANDYFYSFFGYSTSLEARSAGFTSLKPALHSSDHSSLHEKIKRCLNGEIVDFSCRISRKDVENKFIWLLLRFRYLTEEHRLIAAVFDITRIKQMEERLRIGEEEFRIASEQSGSYIIRYDIKTKTEYRTKKASEYLGTPMVVENVPDSVIASGAIADESITAFRNFFEAIFRGEPTGSALFKVQRKGRRAVWRRLEFTSIFDSEGKPFQAVITLTDATEQHEREIAYMQHRQRINDAVQNGAMYYEFNLIKDICEHEEGSSFPNFLDSGQRSYSDYYRLAIKSYIHKDYNQKFIDFFSRERLISDFYNGIFEEWADVPILFPDGEYKWMRATVHLIFDPYSSDIKALLLIEDIDKQKQAELQILSRSEVEPLTGLLNRITFVEKVTLMINESKKEALHALVLIDIDNFKQINDRFGHIYGDKILYDTSANILSRLKKDDIIGRYGGDEIIVFLNSISSFEDIAERVEALRKSIYRRISGGLRVSGSLGVALYPKDGTDYGQLCLNADAALYEAKRSGRNKVVFFSPSTRKISPVSHLSPAEEAIISSDLSQ